MARFTLLTARYAVPSAKQVVDAVVVLYGVYALLIPNVNGIQPARLGAQQVSCLTEFLLTLGADVELLPETRADGVVELVGVANVELLAGRQPNVAFLARAVGPQLESGG